MTDAIAIRDIRAFGRHGALPGERDHPQAFDDDLAQTVDYAALHARVVRIVGDRSFQLLERLGDAILEDVMRDKRIARATLWIRKPRLLDGATPAVRVGAQRARA